MKRPDFTCSRETYDLIISALERANGQEKGNDGLRYACSYPVAAAANKALEAIDQEERKGAA